MKKTGIIHIFILLLLMLGTSRVCFATDYDDNISIADERVRYIMSASAGQPSKIKIIEQTVYSASRADGFVYATAMFSDDISIDKASAPGVTPLYRSWEDDDMFYTGARICFLKVPVKKGKTAKVTFERTIHTPEQFTNIFASNHYATANSLVTIEIPAELASRYHIEPVNLTPQMEFGSTKEKNGSVVYTLRSSNRKPFRYESGAASAAIEAPQLIVHGRFADADDLYSYFHSFIPATADTVTEIRELAEALTKNTDNTLVKIDSIASWVRQNIRYIAVEHGEYGIRPANAADVLEKRYGDCKGSASLIKTLLRAAGIDGRLVWIGTANETLSDWENLPSLMSGNHQIAAAVLPDTIVYIDGTTAWAQAGYIPDANRGQQVMIEDGDRCLLRRVPHMPDGYDKFHINADLKVDGADLCGSVVHSMTGSPRYAIAATYHSIPARNRLRFLRDMVAYPKKNFDSGTPRFCLDSPAAPTCSIAADSITDIGAARLIGDKIYIDLRPVRDPYMKITDLKDRTRGLAAPYPHTFTTDFTLSIPDGYEPEFLPDRYEFSDKWFAGFIEYGVADGKITCKTSVENIPAPATLEEIEIRNKAIKAINRASETKIILRKL